MDFTFDYELKSLNSPKWHWKFYKEPSALSIAPKVEMVRSRIPFVRENQKNYLKPKQSIFVMIKIGKNPHTEQAAAIPEHVDPEIHCIHMEPCYKKYTLIISQVKRKQSDDGNQ